MSDTIDVNINILDESTNSIPYVTVLHAVNADPKHMDPLYSNGANDLWRITNRYRSTTEFILRFGEQPIDGIFVPKMSDKLGYFNDVFDYQKLTGSGNKYNRPNPTSFSYTFVKKGYFPEKYEFKVPTNTSEVKATITLKRDPNEPIEAAPYIQAYERLRYELSDTSKNETMSSDNEKRIIEIEEELEKAAQEAIAANDKEAAARIYIRMRYLPSLILGGGIRGFRQTDLTTERSKRVWSLAKKLDPSNLFVWMHSVYDDERTGNTSDTPKDKELRNKVLQVENLIEEHGLAAWPIIYYARVNLYTDMNQKAKARKLYLEAQNLEPKFTPWHSDRRLNRLYNEKNNH